MTEGGSYRKWPQRKIATQPRAVASHTLRALASFAPRLHLRECAGRLEVSVVQSDRREGHTSMTPEAMRLQQAQERTAHWRRWGPYLSERQWGTVREDYSAYGAAWDFFPHDHARSRAYRWGEDGLAGI